MLRGYKGHGKLETSSLNDALCQVLLTWPSGSGGVDLDKNVKSLQRRLQQRRHTTVAAPSPESSVHAGELKRIQLF